MASDDANAHVKEYLKHYIEFPHAPRYAVMLRGAWGIGKTYLVRRYLDDYFSSKGGKAGYKYVSLYGVTNIEEIDSAVMAAHYPLLSGKAAKLFARAAGMGLEFAGIESKPKASELVEKVKPGLYVFDDIERCDVSINSILGYINEFVEHDECKVILIANEAERSGGQEYRRRKEKLIGKTLEVQSSLSEAFAYFTETVDDEFVRELVEGHAETVSTVFLYSGTENLRILQQTIWDFERLASAFTEDHKKNVEALREVATAFFALSFEVKAGRLTDRDLEERASRMVAALSAKKDGEKGPYLKAVERYPDIDIGTPLLSNAVLKDVLWRGLVDKAAIQAALNASPQFAKPEDVPAWRVLWDWTEQDDSVASNALVEMEKQVANREFTIPGEMLHVFGLRLAFSTLGVLKKTRDEVVEEAKAYIDDLYVVGKLSENERGAVSAMRRSGYGGLGIYEHESHELRGIAQYLDEKREKTASDRLPEKASALLKEMTVDSHLFYRRLNITNSGDSSYYDIPVLSHMNVDEFVTEFLSLHPAQQRTVGVALKERYTHGPSTKELISELKWLEALEKNLQPKVEKMPPIKAARLEQLLKWAVKDSIQMLREMSQP
jgi:hypothetical protein